MYLLIDIGNTRIKWQHRGNENILDSSSMMVEDFMDIDFSDLQSVKKVFISNNDYNRYLFEKGSK